jgi:hypothetical protein
MHNQLLYIILYELHELHKITNGVQSAVLLIGSIYSIEKLIQTVRQYRGVQFFSKSNFNILDARIVTLRKASTKEPQMFVATC